MYRQKIYIFGGAMQEKNTLDELFKGKKDLQNATRLCSY